VPRDVSAEEVWRPLFKKYNQSYKGLRQGGFVFDRDEYWRYHRQGVESFLSTNTKLGEMLSSLPQRKVIFTNCREREALEALVALGIENHFERIYGADFLQDYCKVRPSLSPLLPTSSLCHHFPLNLTPSSL
jgi:putative hydrolase of the HAD superfamily